MTCMLSASAEGISGSGSAIVRMMEPVGDRIRENCEIMYILHSFLCPKAKALRVRSREEPLHNRLQFLHNPSI